MTTELTYLVWAAALNMVQLLVLIVGATMQVPLAQLAGNREPPIECTGWVGRVQRSHRNMLESLALFAILVLVAHVSGRSNEMTALGAAIYFWGRVAHTAIYWLGITWVRSLVFAVSMIGLVLMLFQLL